MKILIAITILANNKNCKYEITQYNKYTNCYEHFKVSRLDTELQAFYDKCLKHGYSINHNDGDIYYSI